MPPLSAIDDSGKPVDWWFMYKISGKSTVPGSTAHASLPDNEGEVEGTEYVYFDSTGSETTLVLSNDRVVKSGALPNTLNQLYGAAAAANKRLGWFFYNDENPITGKTTSARGHTKGVLAFDFKTNSAFWLVQSVPKFPPKNSYSYPTSGEPNAQTLLCITLADVDVAHELARQMFSIQEPNVYLASAVPTDIADQPNDPRVKLMQNKVASGTTPMDATIPFLSKAGTKFMSIAKNAYWGLDFYNDLVGPALHDDLDVETWEHDPTPPPEDSDKVHRIIDMKGVDLSLLAVDPRLNIEWLEPEDHAKLAISAASEETHFICVGDINFTIAQRKRGGGTVAFKCEPLWESISRILIGVTVPPVKRQGSAGSMTNPPKKARASAQRVNALRKELKKATHKQTTDKKTARKKSAAKKGVTKKARTRRPARKDR